MEAKSCSETIKEGSNLISSDGLIASSSETSEATALTSPKSVSTMPGVGGSKLSVDAKEFVPQFSQSIQTSSTASFSTNSNYSAAVGNQVSDNSEQQDPFLDYFLQVLYDVTYHPGHFEPMCSQLMSTLESTPNLDEQTIKLMVESLISQAVWEPNFRYNGARLCNNLSRNLVTPANIPTFRYILLNRCKEIHEDRHNLVQSEAEFLRGFALFLSELLIHMTLGETSMERRFPVIGTAARDLLQTLLDHPTPANVKCLCQILKLSGSVMDDDDRQAHGGVSVDMELLMKNVKTKAVTHEMPQHLKEMLLNLIDLRASDWGRAPTTPAPPMRPNYASASAKPERGGKGDYYGPDGQILTPEERAFLAQSGINLDDENEDYDYHDEQDGMDDEMFQAFEEFLRMPKNKSKPK